MPFNQEADVLAVQWVSLARVLTEFERREILERLFSRSSLGHFLISKATRFPPALSIPPAVCGWEGEFRMRFNSEGVLSGYYLAMLGVLKSTPGSSASFTAFFNTDGSLKTGISHPMTRHSDGSFVPQGQQNLLWIEDRLSNTDFLHLIDSVLSSIDPKSRPKEPDGYSR